MSPLMQDELMSESFDWLFDEIQNSRFAAIDLIEFRTGTASGSNITESSTYRIRSLFEQWLPSLVERLEATKKKRFLRKNKTEMDIYWIPGSEEQALVYNAHRLLFTHGVSNGVANGHSFDDSVSAMNGMNMLYLPILAEEMIELKHLELVLQLPEEALSRDITKSVGVLPLPLQPRRPAEEVSDEVPLWEALFRRPVFYSALNCEPPTEITEYRVVHIIAPNKVLKSPGITTTNPCDALREYSEFDKLFSEVGIESEGLTEQYNTWEAILNDGTKLQAHPKPVSGRDTAIRGSFGVAGGGA